jgi:hypothetical protein
MSFGRGAGNEQALAGTDEAVGDGCDLSGSLALTENDFRKTLAGLAMLVDSREPEVLEWLLAQDLKELRVRSLRRKISRTDVIEERAKLLAVHTSARRPKWLMLVDFGPSRTIESSIGSRDRIISI